MIASKPVFPTYLNPLLPTDQVFDFEELEYHYQVANRTEDIPDTKKGASNISYFVFNIFFKNEFIVVEDGENEDEAETDPSNKNDSSNSSQNNSQSQNSSNIDNPYLQAAKIPNKAKIEG